MRPNDQPSDRPMCTANYKTKPYINFFLYITYRKKKFLKEDKIIYY